MHIEEPAGFMTIHCKRKSSPCTLSLRVCWESICSAHA